jgi:lysyl-tRNA synthetase class 2
MTSPFPPGPLPSPWWERRAFEDRRPFLLARARLMARLRQAFADWGFLEVETPILQRSPGNETHLHAFATDLVTPDGARERLYLRTSPEFSAKKLLAAGEERIVEFARVFRNRERGRAHSPEFTMVEWYRAEAPYTVLMADCARLLALAAEVGGVSAFAYRGNACDPFAEPERLTLVEAFARHAEIDLEAVLPPPGAAPDATVFAAAARRAGVRTAPDDGWSDIFSRVLVEKVEPRLGIGRATILCEYPVSEAALARAKPSDPRFAERFELYACGLELANAFGELTDPTEQHQRFSRDMDEKQRLYGERYPIDGELIAALALMPQASGCALGFDRLAMLATGARRIEDVLFVPVSGPQMLP